MWDTKDFWLPLWRLHKEKENGSEEDFVYDAGDYPLSSR
jgi:hypothetical protein